MERKRSPFNGILAKQLLLSSFWDNISSTDTCSCAKNWRLEKWQMKECAHMWQIKIGTLVTNHLLLTSIIIINWTWFTNKDQCTVIDLMLYKMKCVSFVAKTCLIAKVSGSQIRQMTGVGLFIWSNRNLSS